MQRKTEEREREKKKSLIGFMEPKKASLLFLIVLASSLLVSLAGQERKMMKKYIEQGLAAEDFVENYNLENEEAVAVHPRKLIVKTNDYGGYNPAPSVDKPPYKQIPN